MYSDDDLDAAVQAHVLKAEDVSAFRAFIDRRQSGPTVDEEHFRLLTGFNDIFVSIAILLTLGALTWLVSRASWQAAGLALAAASWAGGEFFTRKRRMALPSILLLAAFVGGVFMVGMSLAATYLSSGDVFFKWNRGEPARLAGLSALASAGFAWLHWLRFRVPITVAAGAAALAATLLGVAVGSWPGLEKHLAPLILAAGLAVFPLAMWWDLKDRERRTRRSDVAFWLHLLAAPLLVHPLFSMLGMLDGGAMTFAKALAAVGIYLALALVALVVDRRALLVSALAYVVYAISSLLDEMGSLDQSLALTALVIGSALLLLSALWHRARALVLAPLPGGWRDRLPPV